MNILRNLILLFIMICGLESVCQNNNSINKNNKKMKLKINVSEKPETDFLPSKYTCDGRNISPPLVWTSAPENTVSFALICDDPDAPSGDWVHWVIFNIPANVSLLTENLEKKKIFENGTKQGVNDFRKIGYDGPCPPGGTHRYFFKLFALDTILDLNSGASKNQLINAMKGHIIEHTQMIKKYSRK